MKKLSLPAYKKWLLEQEINTPLGRVNSTYKSIFSMFLAQEGENAGDIYVGYSCYFLSGYAKQTYPMPIWANAIETYLAENGYVTVDASNALFALLKLEKEGKLK